MIFNVGGKAPRPSATPEAAQYLLQGAKAFREKT